MNNETQQRTPEQMADDILSKLGRPVVDAPKPQMMSGEQVERMQREAEMANRQPVPLPVGVTSVEDLLAPRKEPDEAQTKIVDALNLMSERLQRLEDGGQQRQEPAFSVNVGEDVDDGVKHGFEQLTAKINMLTDTVSRMSVPEQQSQQSDGRVDGELQKLKNHRFDEDVSRIPGWGDLKTNPEFIQFLVRENSPTDPQGRTYHDILTEARSSGNAAIARGIVDAFRATQPEQPSAPNIPQGGMRSGALVPEQQSQLPEVYSGSHIDSWAHECDRIVRRGGNLDLNSLWKQVEQVTTADAQGRVDWSR